MSEQVPETPPEEAPDWTPKQAREAIEGLHKKVDDLLAKLVEARTPEQKQEIKEEIKETKETIAELPAPERQEPKTAQKKPKQKTGMFALWGSSDE